MKRKITAVLLCVALLLTLSVNVSAEEFLQTEIEIINRPEWVKENIYCGTHSGVILGDPNLVVQQ